jgi:hypothetical protein
MSRQAAGAKNTVRIALRHGRYSSESRLPTEGGAKKGPPTVFSAIPRETSRKICGLPCFQGRRPGTAIAVGASCQFTFQRVAQPPPAVIRQGVGASACPPIRGADPYGQGPYGQGASVGMAPWKITWPSKHGHGTYSPQACHLADHGEMVRACRSTPCRRARTATRCGRMRLKRCSIVVWCRVAGVMGCSPCHRKTTRVPPHPRYFIYPPENHPLWDGCETE